MTGSLDIIELDSTESTMLEASERLDSGKIQSWTAIVAQHQTQGRGRSDRVWESEPGQALLSTVVAQIDIPHERIGLIALATGSAIARGLQEWGVRCSLKWPNDVLLGYRKLGGVLIQTRLGDRVTALIGIGINISSVPPNVAAASLADVLESPPGPRRLLEGIADQLRSRFDLLERGRWQDIATEWAGWAVWIGETVVVDMDGERTGEFLGIDDYGCMILLSDGREHRISTADLVRGPRVPA